MTRAAKGAPTSRHAVPPQWARLRHSAPFRATVRRKARLDADLSSPDLVACSRVLPGGRMLLAFDSAALRDLFVMSHEGQGARAEADDYEGPERAPLP